MDNETIYRRVEEEFRCDHARTHLTRFVKSNGTVEYRVQCLRCGVATRTPRKAELTGREMDAAPAFDPELRAGWLRRRTDRQAALYAAAKEEEGREWWARYEAHLRSPAWHRRRELVMRRARGMCEGCLVHPAVQVHHLTYERVGEEMLFDLVAVCRQCHSKIHAQPQPSPALRPEPLTYTRS